jgi:2-amino-4-hydroxy-6-hydroxymethyldihydropteridine diphosphokinase
MANLQTAISALPPMVQQIAVSPVYETAPWGYTEQPAFLNQVIQAETDLAPLNLLEYLKSLETALGRKPTFRYGPRVIDLDILFYDNLIMSTPELTIPHPNMHERAFVLLPLADLTPDLRHPILGKPVKELLEGVDREGIKLYTTSTSI